MEVRYWQAGMKEPCTLAEPTIGEDTGAIVYQPESIVASQATYSTAEPDHGKGAATIDCADVKAIATVLVFYIFRFEAQCHCAWQSYTPWARLI